MSATGKIRLRDSAKMVESFGFCIAVKYDEMARLKPLNRNIGHINRIKFLAISFDCAASSFKNMLERISEKNSKIADENTPTLNTVPMPRSKN